MHRLLATAVSCILVSAASLGLMMLADFSGGAPPASPPSTPTASATATQPAHASTDPNASAADEAAARHAKRTGCLKSARTKKLVGAKRTNYVKDCMAAP